MSICLKNNMDVLKKSKKREKTHIGSVVVFKKMTEFTQQVRIDNFFPCLPISGVRQGMLYFKTAQS